MSAQWYYMLGDKKLGPVTAGQLKQLAQTGQLQPKDHVWKEGMKSWVPAGKVKGLLPDKPAANTPNVPPPVPPQKSNPLMWIAALGGTVALGLAVFVGWWMFGDGSDKPELAKGVQADNAERGRSNPHSAESNPTAPGQSSSPVDTKPPADGRPASPAIDPKIPDFSQVDYSVPFNEDDYQYDFSNLDYTKGPDDQPLQTTIEYKLYDGTTTLERPTDSGRIEHRRVSSFYMENGKPVKHGIEAVYTMDQRAILAGESLPNGGKGADSDYARWKFDSDRDLANGFIKIEYADKISEMHWYKGELHGPVRMWFPSRKLGVYERNTEAAKQTLNRRLPGHLRLQSQSVRGKAHGKSIIWALGEKDPKNNYVHPVYKEGELWRLNGVEHGPEKEWLEDGSTWVGTWRNGKMHGHWGWHLTSDAKMKLPDGTGVSGVGELPYFEGRWHGIEKGWYDDNRKLILYERTCKHGTVLLHVGYFPNGQMSRKVIYRDNKQVSKLEWKEDGTLITVAGQPSPKSSSGANTTDPTEEQLGRRANAIAADLKKFTSEDEMRNWYGSPDVFEQSSVRKNMYLIAWKRTRRSGEEDYLAVTYIKRIDGQPGIIIVNGDTYRSLDRLKSLLNKTN